MEPDPPSLTRSLLGLYLGPILTKNRVYNRQLQTAAAAQRGCPRQPGSKAKSTFCLTSVPPRFHQQGARGLARIICTPAGLFRRSRWLDHHTKCNFKLQSDHFRAFPTSAVPPLAAGQASWTAALVPAEALMFESLAPVPELGPSSHSPQLSETWTGSAVAGCVFLDSLSPRVVGLAEAATAESVHPRLGITPGTPPRNGTKAQTFQNSFT